jgi:aminoglycoside phosphotransferase family enzyme/predicted kinase
MMPETESQTETLEFLSRLAAAPAMRGKRFDTHSASIFLIDDRAYKLKRAVRFPFLDYSTLEKRRHACEQELLVNLPNAPSIYIGVKPITRDGDGSLAIDGHGTVVDWVLQMNRFDERQTLDILVPANRFDSDSADELGRIIASMHQHALPADGHEWLTSIPVYLSQAVEALTTGPLKTPKEEVAFFEKAFRDRLEALMPRLDARARRGLVRRCHGDLHLGNIVMIDRKPLLFDAVEFDERIATIDIMYDIAFLLMDFIKLNRSALATIALNRYLVETTTLNNQDGLEALALFMTLRAAIRAHVTAARAERLHPSEQGRTLVDARSYFELAKTLLDPPQPRLIAIGGLSGTGKSALARSLASHVKPEPGAIVLRSDVQRKLLAGIAETEQLPASYYTKQSSEQLYSHLRKQAAEILSYGHSVIVDAVHATPEERLAVEQVAATMNIAFKGLFLTADSHVRERRVVGRINDASDATPDIVKLQQSYDLGAVGWALIDANGSESQTLNKAISLLP